MIKDAHRHWMGPPTWAQLLDTCHHWHQYRDPRAADLITQTLHHQLQEAQQAANEETMLQYKQWLQTGYNKGLRGLFRSLKSSELAWERPYRTIPLPQRMDQRLRDWGGLWHIRQDNDPHPRPSLQHEAMTQAQQLEPLTAGQLQRVLKALPDKASGPDAVSTQLLRTLMDDKPVLVTHVTRNTMIRGIATKREKILNPYGTFKAPQSLDGLARSSSEFVPAALICHRGPSHDTGHYFAILIYRDLMWIADDGKPPMHLDHLTPQLASQITQVWAVHIDTFRTTQQVIRSETLKSMNKHASISRFEDARHLEFRRQQCHTWRHHCAGRPIMRPHPSGTCHIQGCGYQAFLWQATECA